MSAKSTSYTRLRSSVYGVGLLKSTVENASITIDRTEADSMDTSTIREGTSTNVLSTTTDIAADNTAFSSLENLKMCLEQEKAASEKYEKALESCLLDCTSSLEIESRHATSVEGQLSPIMYDTRTMCQDVTLYVGDKYFNLPDQRTPGFSCHSDGATSVIKRLSRSSLTGSGRGLIDAEVVHDPFSLPSTLSDRVYDLHQTILSERQADVLFELRLKSLLEPTFM